MRISEGPNGTRLQGGRAPVGRLFLLKDIDVKSGGELFPPLEFFYCYLEAV